MLTPSSSSSRDGPPSGTSILCQVLTSTIDSSLSRGLTTGVSRTPRWQSSGTMVNGPFPKENREPSWPFWDPQSSDEVR